MKNRRKFLPWFISVILLCFVAVSLSLYGDINAAGKSTNLDAIFKNSGKQLSSLKKFYQDFEKKNVKHIDQWAANNTVFTIAGKSGVTFAGTYQGKEEIKKYLNDLFRMLSDMQIIYQFNLVNGNSVNTHVQIMADLPSVTKKLNIELVYHWVLQDDGKIKSLYLYYDTNTWHKAFQSSGALKTEEDIKGGTDFSIKQVNYDSLQVVKDIYNAFNSGNIPGVLEKFDDKIVFLLKGDPTMVPFEGKFIGKDGFLQFVKTLSGAAQYLGVPVNKDFIVQGNRVDAFVYEELKCLATGKKFSSEICHSFILNDTGKILEFKSYNDSFDVVQAFQP